MATAMDTLPILVADDDPEDRMLAKEALEASRLVNPLYFVSDGEELMDFLLHRGQYAAEAPPRPGLILLDLKMPKKDGFEVLADLKSRPTLRRIPVIVLTTSRSPEDIFRSYDLGVNSFITKPVTFAGLVDAMKVLGRYWFELVEHASQATGG